MAVVTTGPSPVWRIYPPLYGRRAGAARQQVIADLGVGMTGQALDAAHGAPELRRFEQELRGGRIGGCLGGLGERVVQALYVPADPDGQLLVGAGLGEALAQGGSSFSLETYQNRCCSAGSS